MTDSKSNAYKNQKRRESRSKIREALFVHEYVETKYFHIYEEVAKVYNALNETYPCKPDLRRTEEFRIWKNSIAMERSFPSIPVPRQKQRRYAHTPHNNIPLPLYVDHTSNLTVLPDEGNENSVPRTETESSPSTPESIQTKLDSGKIMQLNTSNLTVLPDEGNENSVPRTETESSPSTPESIQTKLDSGKIMQLKIPLLTPAKKNPDSVQTSVEMPSEILETVMDEVIQESNDILHPSLLDEISPEIIDKIISELREEPELMDIVAGIEVGLDIDIPDLDDPLEDELENILW